MIFKLFGSYYDWGWGNRNATTFLFVGYSENYLKKCFSKTELSGINYNPYGIKNEEEGIQIVVCREPVKPLDALWPEFKYF